MEIRQNVPCEQFEATVSESTVPSPLLHALKRSRGWQRVVFLPKHLKHSGASRRRFAGASSKRPVESRPHPTVSSQSEGLKPQTQCLSDVCYISSSGVQIRSSASTCLECWRRYPPPFQTSRVRISWSWSLYMCMCMCICIHIHLRICIRIRINVYVYIPEFHALSRHLGLLATRDTQLLRDLGQVR